MHRYVLCAAALALAGGSAAVAFSGTPEGQNAGNGWMDTLSLPALSSTSQQPFRLFKKSSNDGVNHMRESRAFFRLDGDTREWNYGPGTTTQGNNVTSSFVGTLDGTLNTGGLNNTITGPTGGGLFTSEQRWQIAAGLDGPRVKFKETVTNVSPTERIFYAYHYFASGLDNTNTNTVSAARDPNRYFVDGPESMMEVRVPFQTRADAALEGVYISTDGSARTMMLNGVVNDISGETFVGGPSGTVQMIFQWRLTLGAGESVEIGYEFGFIPAPGGAALLAFAGLHALRRRR